MRIFAGIKMHRMLVRLKIAAEELRNASRLHSTLTEAEWDKVLEAVEDVQEATGDFYGSLQGGE